MTEARDYEDRHDDLDNQDCDDEVFGLSWLADLFNKPKRGEKEYEPDERIRNQFR